jgi:RNA polymerase sigma-70 factor (ECF subfamily)
VFERRHIALKQCLGKLRSSDRELLMHRYATAETLFDYAQKSGRSTGGLKVTLHRLRNALLSCIGKHVGPEPLES